MKRSHMTGGLLIQSPCNDREGEKCIVCQYFQNLMKSLDLLQALFFLLAKVTKRYFLK